MSGKSSQTTSSQTTSWQATLDTARARLPGSDASERLRRDALTAFSTAGFPTRREEAWKYTDLKPLTESDFEIVPAAPGEAEREQARALIERSALPGSGARLVFIDAHHIPELSSTDGSGGFEIAALADAWQAFERSAQPRSTFDGHPLALLNTAFTQQGAWIHVPAGVRVTEPVHLVFAGSGASRLAPQPRVVIELEADAELTVVQHYLDAGDAAGWVNAVTQITQAASSRLNFYRLQEHGRRQFHTELLTADIAADAELSLACIDVGGCLVRNDIDVRLREPGACAELFGLFIAGDGQHIDNHTRIDHIAPATRSDEAFRGIAAGDGRGVFNGKVIVRQDAQRIDARQSSDNLLLGERAEIDTKPELEIYADDVKCSHGATVGELDETQLHYLRCRGLGEQAARALLTFAFANSVLERIRSPELREPVASRIMASLPGHEPAGEHV